jgi:hypothetical protein
MVTMGPPNGGPEGNNHEDDEVGDSDGQIWKLAVGVSVYSQHTVSIYYVSEAASSKEQSIITQIAPIWSEHVWFMLIC